MAGGDGISGPASRPGRWLTGLRSGVFLVVLFVSIVLYACVTFATVVLPVKSRIRFTNGWVAFFTWWLKACCGLGYELRGVENLPRRPAVIFARHSSAWETMALQRRFPPYCWIIKRELLWVPFFGWGLAMLRPIAIDRSSGHHAVERIAEQGAERLGEGLWVMCFPEATRMTPGQRRRFGMGGAVLAARTGAPVVPVAHDAGCYWRRRGFLKFPGTIRVEVGPVLETRGRQPDEINRIAKEWIDSTTSRLEREAGGIGAARKSGECPRERGEESERISKK